MKSFFNFIDTVFTTSTQVVGHSLNAAARTAAMASNATKDALEDCVIDSAVERNKRIERLESLENIDKSLNELVEEAMKV